MRRRLLSLAATVTAVSLSASCAVKNPPDAAAIKAAAMPKTTVPQGWVAGRAGSGVVPDNWAASFGDPQLSAAIDEAQLTNPDLRVAATRVEQAMLYAKLAGAKLYPSVDVIAKGGGKMSGDNSGLTG